MTRLRRDSGGQVRWPRNTVLVGDAHEHLRGLPTASVDCIVTSPPYFSLRNYQVSGQLGLEASVHEWVGHLLPVTDELARVLKPAGTLWLNLGDSYSRHGRYGVLAKGLVLAPERLLLALSDRGWRVRNKVVWAKPNPMPASASDRLTSSWESIYLLVRSRHYYFDLDSVREPHRSVRSAAKQRLPRRTRPAEWAGPLAGSQSGLDVLHGKGMTGHPLGKNPGDLWRVATGRGPAGHHATFPEALVRRPILAGTLERVCALCGLAWRRKGLVRSLGRVATVGAFRPGCACVGGYRPGLVLDPFMGSGTVGVVAAALGRDWLGIELNPDFAASSIERIRRATQT
jgi:DNA modification methylase